MAGTKVITGKVRFSYVSIFQKKSFNGEDGKYQITLLIPKTDKKTVSKIKAAIKAATDEGITSKWNGKKPGKLWNPLQDGDEDGKAETNPEYEGMYFVCAKSNSRPGIVDKDLNEILDPDEVYSGAYGRASITFYPYNNSSNGIAAALNNVQKLADGDRLGSARATAEEDFGDDEDFDEEEDF
jgi:archaellum component FlaG (FlaF/FlaG flagellin family)